MILTKGGQQPLANVRLRPKALNVRFQSVKRIYCNQFYFVSLNVRLPEGARQYPSRTFPLDADAIRAQESGRLLLC